MSTRQRHTSFLNCNAVTANEVTTRARFSEIQYTLYIYVYVCQPAVLMIRPQTAVQNSDNVPGKTLGSVPGPQPDRNRINKRSGKAKQIARKASVVLQKANCRCEHSTGPYNICGKHGRSHVVRQCTATSYNSRLTHGREDMLQHQLQIRRTGYNLEGTCMATVYFLYRNFVHE